jgi:hypothetical protein
VIEPFFGFRERDLVRSYAFENRGTWATLPVGIWELGTQSLRQDVKNSPFFFSELFLICQRLTRSFVVKSKVDSQGKLSHPFAQKLF